MPGRWRSFRWLAALALAGMLIVGCRDEARTVPSRPTTPAAGAAPTSAPLAGKVTVFAASSLTDVFKAIAADFQQANPGVTVEFNFAASSALATQIEQAAPADVFASADTANMTRLTGPGLVEGPPATFARNLPVIVVPAANRAAIAGAGDLARPGVKLVLAGPEVPIGNYARQILERLAAMPEYGAGYREATLRNLVSNEQNVRAVLTKVELGEADAGIVYQTDAQVSASKARTVAIPAAANVIATYPIGIVKATKNRDAATAFMRFVVGPQGQARLGAAGFAAAP